MVHAPSLCPVWAHNLLSHYLYATSFSCPGLLAFGAHWTSRREQDESWRWWQSKNSAPTPQTALPCSAPTLSLSPSVHSLWLYPLFPPLTTRFWLHFPAQTGRDSGLWCCWCQPVLFNNYHWIFRWPKLCLDSFSACASVCILWAHRSLLRPGRWQDIPKYLRH